MTDIRRLLTDGLKTHETLSNRERNATTLKESQYCKRRLGRLQRWLTWLEYSREFNPEYRIEE